MTNNTFSLGDAELSDWQPPLQRPTKSGTVWERDMPGTAYRAFSRWNGKMWMQGCCTIEEAAKSRTPSTHQYLPWRGLKYDPNLRSK